MNECEVFDKYTDELYDNIVNIWNDGEMSDAAAELLETIIDDFRRAYMVAQPHKGE